MRGNIIASIAVFQSLYSNNHDVYSILAQFVTATINQKKLWTFDITTLRNQLRECFEIDVYDSVLKTVIRNRLKETISNSNGEYYATPSAAALEEFNTQLLKQSEKYKFVFDALIAYYKSSTSQSIADNDIINSFTKYLLTDYNQDSEHIFSRFILSNENDEYFVSCLNEIKEGFIIISGLKDISESTDLNSTGSWTNKLIIYLDTEELFSAYGYNGDLHYQILSDFLSLVKEANKRDKYIELRYLDETKNVVDGYFKQAIRIVEKRDRPDGKPAMNTILGRCNDTGSVLEEQGKFYAFLKTHNINYDERSNYVVDMSGNLQTEENLNAIKTDLPISSITIVNDEDILKYLRIFSIINNKRHQNNKVNFERCQCVLLTENSIPKYISWHDSIHENSDFTFSTTMDYAISKLWFRLNKGLLRNQRPATFDVINRVKIVMTSLLHQSVLKKYEELDAKGYSQDERINIYNSIRTYEIHPEEITNQNIEEIVNFIETKDIETLRREKAVLQEKLKQGEIASRKLKSLTKRVRDRYKAKALRGVILRIYTYYFIWVLIYIGVGYIIFLILSKIISPQDTQLSILSFVLSCFMPYLLSCVIPYTQKIFRLYKKQIIWHSSKTLLEKYARRELNE